MRKAIKDGAGSKWRPAMKITIQITVESDAKEKFRSKGLTLHLLPIGGTQDF